jgi:hypothetical protein
MENDAVRQLEQTALLEGILLAVGLPARFYLEKHDHALRWARSNRSLIARWGHE